MASTSIQKANRHLTKILEKHKNVTQAKYLFLKGETHMSIPPLSFYYGVKHLLQANVKQTQE
jgi:hypothetical protein